MTTVTAHIDAREDRTTMYGFWLYLMTDFMLFATLFSVFIVLRGNVFASDPGMFFSTKSVLAETLILLASSFTCGMFVLAARSGHDRSVLTWMYITIVLGIAFLCIEVAEFRQLIIEGHTPQASGFFSAFFTLVGTHGLHILAGLIWMVSLAAAIVQRGLTRSNMRKLLLLSMFWHFLDIVWIFIFTIVYLIAGV